MMSVKEQVTQALDSLSDAELRQVAEYVDFLRFRARRTTTMLSDTELAVLYAEFADEDRTFAEEGIAEYSVALQAEDAA